MANHLSHTFDQVSWRLIKEFVGIYGINMDYTKIYNLHVSFIYDALRWSESIKPIFVISTLIHDPLRLKTILLKRVAKGYKNIMFYEELKNMLENPYKV